ncbi:TerC family protein [Paenibacillus lemnae]|uniref:TerC family protein n=1 Tax=Paenibacillus lemnae TaxID=1330551 RepID=A0A848M2N4_PAELE|nr:TerC family protein [Paenibacillus lemnae]NMO94806.1 TerC family protein [Paenibacillus lemnae]
MEIFSGEFFLALVQIVFLDLVLAGDNAIVIGLAARNLQPATQKKAILLGTAGAVLLRILATILVVWLLEIPWLLLIGGILLIGIAYKLLTDEDDHSDIQAGQHLWTAIRTIIIADAAMGLDNVIAVAGAAEHNNVLVVLGLLISVPIVVWGSTLFIKLINRYPWIIYLGAAVLGYTASSMITDEEHFTAFFDTHPLVRGLFIAAVVLGVLAAGHFKKQASRRQREQTGT